MPDQDLKTKILKEMSVDHKNSLEKHFDIAKNLIKITTDGKVEIVHKDSLQIADQILLYLIGKLYAKEAELAKTEGASNSELSTELGIGDSVRTILQRLRDSKKVKSTQFEKEKVHIINPMHVEKALKTITRKVSTK